MWVPLGVLGFPDTHYEPKIKVPGRMIQSQNRYIIKVGLPVFTCKKG
jgi:hypothetical protein